MVAREAFFDEKTQGKKSLEKLPKKEKGFEFEYVEFILGAEEEAIIQIGWVPVNATPLRETILAKFGKFHAQIKLVAFAKAPIEKVWQKTDRLEFVCRYDRYNTRTVKYIDDFLFCRKKMLSCVLYAFQIQEPMLNEAGLQ